jgi:hypothetical protein
MAKDAAIATAPPSRVNERDVDGADARRRDDVAMPAASSVTAS